MISITEEPAMLLARSLAARLRLTATGSCRLAAAWLLAVMLAPALAEGIEPLTKGQTVYLPIYSEIRHGNIGPKGKSETSLMSVLVSVRNTDPNNPIRVVSANYYNTDGALLRNSVPTPRVIPPFGTLELFIELRESLGGSGANYAIKWDAAAAVSQPTIEALHSRFQAGYSVAFISRGRAISEP
ncbi:MAG: DUF3124 domain-containing protein [Candidatus Accumulibacter sp.]|nr:DUF3124 domain-containing protein [Accumulibacter sp.]